MYRVKSEWSRRREEVTPIFAGVGGLRFRKGGFISGLKSGLYRPGKAPCKIAKFMIYNALSNVEMRT